MTVKIAFFDAKPYDRKSFDRENQSYNYDIHYFPSKLNMETVKLAEGADAVCVFVNDELSAEVIDELVKLDVKLVALRCAGYNNLDFKYAFEKVHAVRVPAYSPYAVAEHTVALLLSLNRKTHRAYYRTRDNNFSIDGLLGYDLHGKTAGVIGTGRIGKILIGILKGFGMNVIAADKFPKTEVAEELGFTYVSNEELFKQADAVFLNCPLTKETFHMVNNETISLMKEGVCIINTGRGQLIDTRSLIEGLKSRKIGAAGLDVYEEESNYFFEDFSGKVMDDDVLARLISFNNVLVTSHQAFFTEEALVNISSTTLSNVKAFFEEGRAENDICYHCIAGQKGNCMKEKIGKCW